MVAQGGLSAENGGFRPLVPPPFGLLFTTANGYSFPFYHTKRFPARAEIQKAATADKGAAETQARDELASAQLQLKAGLDEGLL
jgi:hypothetical protein